MKKEIKIGNKVKDLVFPSSGVYIVETIITSTRGVYVMLNCGTYRWLHTIALVKVNIQNKLK